MDHWNPNAKEKLQCAGSVLFLVRLPWILLASGNVNLDRAMLGRLSKRFRLRAALGLAALYAFCVLAPHAALALGNAAAHCLTDDHIAAHIHTAKAEAVAHSHGDGTVHDHGTASAHDDSGATVPHQHSGADGKDHKANCCGLFCISAIALESRVALPLPLSVAAIHPGPDDALNGRGPDRLIRPPIT
jgi:hypothetical protein